MTGKTAKAIFWVGTLSSLIIFLWLTYDFHQQEPKYAKTDQISAQVVAGKRYGTSTTATTATPFSVSAPITRRT